MDNLNSSFQSIDFSSSNNLQSEYEDCIFINCNFTETNLLNIKFIECRFENCNLSNAKLNNTAFQNVQFVNCKLIGLHFDYCNPFLFEVGFENCVLNFSCFYKLNLKKCILINCSLQETDFTEADLSNAVFDYCNLENAIFENTILLKTNFSSAYNFIINPEKNEIKKAKFSKNNLEGLLINYDLDLV